MKTDAPCKRKGHQSIDQSAFQQLTMLRITHTKHKTHACCALWHEKKKKKILPSQRTNRKASEPWYENILPSRRKEPIERLSTRHRTERLSQSKHQSHSLPPRHMHEKTPRPGILKSLSQQKTQSSKASPPIAYPKTRLPASTPPRPCVPHTMQTRGGKAKDATRFVSCWWLTDALSTDLPTKRSTDAVSTDLPPRLTDAISTNLPSE